MKKKSTNHSFKKKNAMSALKLASLLSLASIYSSSATSQPSSEPSRLQIMQERDRSLDLFFGVNKGLSNDAKKDFSLDLGFMQVSGPLGIGAFYSLPLEDRYLGEGDITQMRFQRSAPTPHTQVEETVTNSYLRKHSAEGVLSFENKPFSFFLTGGLQYRNNYDLIRKDTFREYVESDGTIRVSDKIVGVDRRFDDISTNFIGGVGFKAQAGRLGGYIRASTTLLRPKTETFISGGLVYKLNQQKRK